ncbi:MAG: Rieske (2Fe-2S) protein [Gemmatimonadota bacterium]
MAPNEFLPSSDGATRLDRRQFLARMEGLAVSVTCGGVPLLLGGCAARAKYVTPIVSGDRLTIPLAHVTPGGGVLVEDPTSDLPLFVHRSAAGTYIAVSTRCGHRGCQVEPAAEKLVCPCHGSEYTFDGAILQGPTQRALVRHRVTVAGESLVIHRDAEPST